MQTVEILKAARALIDTPEKWTRGVYARDLAGGDVHPSDDRAVCFCSKGALMRIAGLGDDYTKAREKLSEHVGAYIVQFNDDPERTHPEVLAAFDAAIAATPSQQMAA